MIRPENRDGDAKPPVSLRSPDGYEDAGLNQAVQQNRKGDVRARTWREGGSGE